MLTILILLLLAFGFYTGAKRGLILQVLYSVGYLISYFVARTYYKEVASHLELYIPYPSVTPTSKLVFFNQEISLDLDKAFYSAVAFLLLLFAGWLVVRFFSYLFTWINIYSSFETGKWTIRWRIKCSCVIRGSFSSVSYGVNDSVRYCPKSVSVKWLGTRHCKKYPNSNKTSI